MNDGLDPTRGVINGLIAGTTVWIVIGLITWAVI